VNRATRMGFRRSSCLSGAAGRGGVSCTLHRNFIITATTDTPPEYPDTRALRLRKKRRRQPDWQATAKRRIDLGSLPAHLPRVERADDIADHACLCCRNAHWSELSHRFRNAARRLASWSAPSLRLPFSRCGLQSRARSNIEKLLGRRTTTMHWPAGRQSHRRSQNRPAGRRKSARA
jgi:hypothetical protein